LPPGFNLKHSSKKGFSGEGLQFVGYSYSRPFGELYFGARYSSRYLTLTLITGNFVNADHATGENRPATKFQVVPDKSAEKVKEELERTQQKMTQEKQHFQAEQRELEGKLKAKITELEAKETELGEEIARRKKAQEGATELEKQKVELEVQIGEIRRKLEKMQEGKQVDGSRISDLEVS